MASNVISKVKKSAEDLYDQGKALVAPDPSIDPALMQKRADIEEYQDATQGKERAPRTLNPEQLRERMRAATLGSALSGASASPARYGSKADESRIDTSEMTRPLGSALNKAILGSALSFHKDGGELDPDKVNITGEDGPEAIVGNEVIPLNHTEDRNPLGTAYIPTYVPKEYEQPAIRPVVNQGKSNGAGTEKSPLIVANGGSMRTAVSADESAPLLVPDENKNPLGSVFAQGADPRQAAKDEVISHLMSSAGMPVIKPMYTGPAKTNVNPGELIPSNDLLADEKAYAHQDLEAKKAELKQKLQSPDLVAVGNARRQLAELEKQTPYGSFSNHPGILGKIEHGLAKVGNIAGDIFAPAATSLIPGTDLNRVRQTDQGEEEVKLGSALRNQDADTASKYAEAQGKLNPKPKLLTGDNDTRTNSVTGQREQAYEMPDGTKQWAPEGQLPGTASAPQAVVGQPHAQYVYGNKSADENKQPVGAEGVQRHDKELATLTAGMAPEEKQDFLSAYSIKPDDTLAVQTKRLDSARSAAALSGGERDRRLARDQRQKDHEEAMAAIGANRALAEGHKDKSETIKARQEIAKIYADPLQSAERYNIMTSNLKDAMPESQGGHNDQQAMLSLLANHLGMTMGLQKGARLNQAIIDEAAKSQPWLSKIDAKFDKDGYLSGLTLSPDQMKSMVNLARERYREDVSKARNVAKYAGAEPGDDGPDRTPSKSTMVYYLGVAGGNKDRAKQLAAEDGWTEGK